MAVSDYLKGAGTSGDPYIIHNKTAMIEWLMVGCGAAKFALIVTDIDMEGYIASTGRPDWKGYLDGCGYTVKNLDFNGQKNFTGEIKKIAFENIRTRSNQVYAGNGGSISDVAFIGGISAGSFIWTYGTIMTRVVSNSPIPIYAETSGSSGVYALPGSGGMGSRSTDLRNHPTPYATSNFSLLTSYPLFWAVDGGSMPRLLKQDVSTLRAGFMVKGRVKVGGTLKNRFVRALSLSDFNRINDAIATTDGLFSINCGFYSDAVMVATYELYGALPVINKSYAIGDVIHPVNPNGFRYLCSKAGNSGTTLPPEPWSTSAALTIGAAIFTPDPVYQPQLHGPIKPVLVDLITGQPV